jgi:hypothetical protein
MTDLHVPADTNLNQWFEQNVPVFTADTRVFLAPGVTYEIDTPLLLGLCDTVEIVGTSNLADGTPTPKSKIILNGPGEVFRLIWCSDTRILDLDLSGPRDPMDDAYYSHLSNDHGVHILGCERITVCNVGISNVNADFVYAGRYEASIELDSTDTVVCGVWGLNCGRNAVSTTAAVGVLVTGCIFDRVRRTVLNLEAWPDWVVADY